MNYICEETPLATTIKAAQTLCGKSANEAKEAGRKWELTDNGKLEVVYRNQLKTCDRMMSAIKTRLEIMQGEAHNQY